jgi:hypothetical protein
MQYIVSESMKFRMAQLVQYDDGIAVVSLQALKNTINPSMISLEGLLRVKPEK